MSRFVVTKKKVNSCCLTSICQHGIPARIVIRTTQSINIQDYNPRDPDNLVVSVNDEDDQEFIKKIENNGMYLNSVDDDDIRFIVEKGSFSY